MPHVGAQPVFADVDATTDLTSETVDAVLTPAPGRDRRRSGGVPVNSTDPRLSRNSVIEDAAVALARRIVADRLEQGRDHGLVIPSTQDHHHG